MQFGEGLDTALTPKDNNNEHTVLGLLLSRKFFD